MGSCQSLPHSDGKAEPKQKGKPQLIIKSFTWSRDSHGLFDYESKTLTKKTMKTMNQGRLVRKVNDVIISKETEPLNANNKDVLKLNVRDGNFWVGSCIDHSNKKDVRIEDWEDNDHSVWLVVKSFKPHGSNKFGYKLTEGDLIKLGRIKFRVKELRSGPGALVSKKPTSDQVDKVLHTDEEANSPVMKEYERKGSKGSDAGSRVSTSQTCRICLGDTAEADDPFFSPCHCSGTMKYIHVLCLQKWLKSKLHVKQTGFSTSVYWKTLECELCKVTFPSTFEIEGKKFDVVEVDRPDCGYLMMEILSKEKNILRGIHIIKMEGKNNIRLGRGHDSDIRITDISVSRCHAIIKLDKGNFYLEDNSSKFGTLVHFRKPFPLVGDFNNISLQVGRTVLSLTVKKNWRSLGWFGGSNIREPVEIDEEEELFSRSNESRAQPVESLSRRPLSMDEPHEAGSFEHDNPGRENGLPSPIQQQEAGEVEEDRISNLSEEDFPEAELPDNEEQQAEGNPRPEGQAAANANENANEQAAQPQVQVQVQAQSQAQQAVAVVEQVENPEQQQAAGNNQEVELVH